jgi:P27 family predicted phage terminase small subunit
MARRPQPLRLRRLHGNPSRRPLPPENEELEPRGGPLGAAPAYLSAEAKAVWERLNDSMPMGVIALCDADLLCAYVTAVALFEQACRELQRTPAVVMGANDVPVVNPWCRLQIRHSLLILRLGSELSLSPTSRASLASKIAAAAGTDFAFPGQRQRPTKLDRYLQQKPDKLSDDPDDSEPN